MNRRKSVVNQGNFVAQEDIFFLFQFILLVIYEEWFVYSQIWILDG